MRGHGFKGIIYISCDHFHEINSFIFKGFMLFIYEIDKFLRCDDAREQQGPKNCVPRTTLRNFSKLVDQSCFQSDTTLFTFLNCIYFLKKKIAFTCVKKKIAFT